MSPDHALQANRAPATRWGVPLLIADAVIPTTRILARALAATFADVEIRAADDLFGASVEGRGIVISRLCHPMFGWLPRYLRERGLTYLYFLDDNFWELTRTLDAHLAAFYQNPAVIATLDDFVCGARATLVMSRRLGAYITARHPAARVEYLVPGFDVAAARALAKSTPATPADPGVVRIGYPTSRRPNIEPLLVPVVETLAHRHAGRIAFEFVGWAPDAVVGLPGVALHPHVEDYDRFIAFMLSRRWDLGIAPLIGDPFEAYKTQVKYREYGGCGIAGVYSRVAPYTDYVTDGVTGLMVDNTPEAWIDAIERLVADPVLRAELSRNAHDDVQRNYNQDATAAELAALLRTDRAA